MDDSPRVSVVIPTYNRLHLLSEAVESVLNQTMTDLELIVVDDGSSDGTADYVQGLQTRGVRLVRSEGREGAGPARNRGIRESRAPFIAFLDSDDRWLPKKLEWQLRLFELSQRVGMVGGGCVYIDAEGARVGSPVLGPTTVEYRSFAVSTRFPGSGSNAVVRRKALDDVGCFDPTLERAQDRDLWMRISRRWEVRCVAEPTVEIRLHDAQRPGDTIDVVLRCRREINRRIPEGDLRRKSTAWMWYNVGSKAFSRGKRLRGIAYWLRSLATHPGRIDAYHRRLQPILETLMPESIYRLVRWIYRRGPHAA